MCSAVFYCYILEASMIIKASMDKAMNLEAVIPGFIFVCICLANLYIVCLAFLQTFKAVYRQLTIINLQYLKSVE